MSGPTPTPNTTISASASVSISARPASRLFPRSRPAYFFAAHAAVRGCQESSADTLCEIKTISFPTNLVTTTVTVVRNDPCNAACSLYFNLNGTRKSCDADQGKHGWFSGYTTVLTARAPPTPPHVMLTPMPPGVDVTAVPCKARSPADIIRPPPITAAPDFGVMGPPAVVAPRLVCGVYSPMLLDAFGGGGKSCSCGGVKEGSALTIPCRASPRSVVHVTCFRIVGADRRNAKNGRSKTSPACVPQQNLASSRVPHPTTTLQHSRSAHDKELALLSGNCRIRQTFAGEGKYDDPVLSSTNLGGPHDLSTDRGLRGTKATTSVARQVRDLTGMTRRDKHDVTLQMIQSPRFGVDVSVVASHEFDATEL